MGTGLREKYVYVTDDRKSRRIPFNVHNHRRIHGRIEGNRDGNGRDVIIDERHIDNTDDDDDDAGAIGDVGRELGFESLPYIGVGCVSATFDDDIRDGVSLSIPTSGR